MKAQTGWRILIRMTHACRIDGLGDFDELLLVGCRILASDKNLDRESSSLQLLEMLRYFIVSRTVTWAGNIREMRWLPFLAVVTT